VPLTYRPTVALVTIDGTQITDDLSDGLEVSHCVSGTVLFWAAGGDFVPSCPKPRLSVVG